MVHGLSSTGRRRPSLSRERILRVALRMADKGGVEALSMRKVAQKLGVEAMSLYNHVVDKDDLIDGIVDLVIGGIDLASDESDWREGMRRRVLSAHEVLTRHPWASSLWMSSRSFGLPRVRYADAVLRGLREGGFSDRLTFHAFHVLQSHLLGYTLQESNMKLGGAELREAAVNFVGKLPVQDFPDFIEHVRQHFEESDPEEDTFEFGLDLILDSLARLKSNS